MNINNHFKKIYFLLKAIFEQLKQAFLELSRVKQIVFVTVVLVLLILSVRFFTSSKAVADLESKPRLVEVSAVSNLSNKSTPIPLVGVVTSVSEATIRAESSGKLTRVYKKLGDQVFAGQIIAEFENSGERASVLQAEGVYESAKAGRDIANINSATTNGNIGDTKNTSLNSITSAYTTMDDLVRTKTDIAFSDARAQSPVLKLLFPDSILSSKIQNERRDIELMLKEREARNRTLTTDADLISEFAKIQTEVQIVKSYLEDLSVAYNKAIPNSDFSQGAIDGQKTSLSIARSTIAGTVSSLTAAKVTLANAIAAQEIAGRTTGDKNPNTASADASVKTAQGSYLAALSRLEKTIIRSPISGALNSLTIETGDFVNQSTQVAVVSNNGALEVQAYVTEEDAKRVAVGSTVKINSTIKGVVTRIAGAIDPSTKKIEVKIGILENNKELINGQSVRIEIANVASKLSSTLNNSATVAKNGIIKIPLSAVKITPRGSYVFTVSASSTLQSVTVETGTLLGEEVQINSGLTSDMEIVKDARGLKEGQTVDVKTN
jgi:RND family efflux transporter MFP subunit